MSDKTIIRIVTTALVVLAAVVVVILTASLHQHGPVTTSSSHTLILHQAPDAKMIAQQHGCKKFKYVGSRNVGTCFIGDQRYEVVTFDDKASRNLTMNSTKKYGYRYLVRQPRAIMYNYTSPTGK